MRLPTLLLAAAASADQFDLRKLEIHRDGDRLRYSYGDKDVSPWHDVPFWADADKTLVHFVCEIPRLTRSKLEIHKSVAGNRLVQDTKGPHPRFYKYSAAVVNYGAISQTWEDPAVADEHTGVGGDNDPIDVLQLNAAPCARGAVQRVRVLGALALVDGGETDWKLLVVDADDSATSVAHGRRRPARPRRRGARLVPPLQDGRGQGRERVRHGRPRHRRRRGAARRRRHARPLARLGRRQGQVRLRRRGVLEVVGV